MHVLRRLSAVFAALAMAACATDPPSTAPGAAAAACCATLAELDARPLGTDAMLELRLDAASPRMELPDGTSPVALLRLPDTPRPLALELTSRQVGGPGVIGRMLLSSSDIVTVHGFSPALVLLDAERRPVRTVTAFGATEGCGLTDLAGTRPLLRMHVPITESAQDVVFALVTTTDAQRNRVSSRCGSERIVFGDVGRLELRARPLPWSDGPLRLSAAAEWKPGAARPGLLSAAWHEVAGADGGRLMLGERHLVYARDRRATLAVETTIPLSDLLAVEADLPTLSVLVRGPDGAAPGWHTFVLQRPTRAPDGTPGDFEWALRSAIPPDQIVEDIGLSVAPLPDRVGFDLQAPPRSSSGGGALSRVGQDAAAAGMVTALPCGLCATGACGPELLLPCAAAFSVGAVIGGTVSLGRELLTGGLRSRPAPPPEPVATGAALGAFGAGRPRLDAAALTQCILDRSQREDGPAWRHQGLTAHLLVQPVAPERATAIRHRVDVQVEGVTLVAVGDAATALASSHLRIDGHVVMTDLRGGAALSRAFAWDGPQRTLGQWAEVTPETLDGELRTACDALSEQILPTIRAGWWAQRATAR
jgi:hypothetical protein